MAKFRKRPVVIEAFQMTEERRWDISEWPNWLRLAWTASPGEGSVWIDPDAPIAEGRESAAKLVCGTLEGVHRISWGDWIIQGVARELYPCKPDIFERTYEAADAKGLDWRQDDDYETRAASVYHDDGTPVDYVINFDGYKWVLTFEGSPMVVDSLVACMAAAEADNAKAAEGPTGG